MDVPVFGRSIMLFRSLTFTAKRASGIINGFQDLEYCAVFQNN
ncbi:hypothetical protein SP21_100 [Salmonella phage 21]|nr:hypothetical protein SP21_100 [Salmonella phage 21]